MPDTNHYTAIPVPYATEANVVPQVMAAQREAMGPGLRLYAATEAEMAARYGNNSIAGPTGVPVGTIVSLPASDWRRMPDNQWQKIFAAPKQSTSAMTVTNSDWLVNNNTVRVNTSGVGSLFLLVVYQGTTPITLPTNPPNGDIGNQTIGTLSSADYFPVVNAPLSNLTAGPVVAGVLNTSGVVTLSAVAPGTVIQSGFQCHLAGTFQAW